MRDPDPRIYGRYAGHARHPDDLAPGAELPEGEGVYGKMYGGAPSGSGLWPDKAFHNMGSYRARPPPGIRYYLDEPGAVDKEGWGWYPTPDGFPNWFERQVAMRNDWLEERQRNWRNLLLGRVQSPPGEGPSQEEVARNQAGRDEGAGGGQWGFVLHDEDDDADGAAEAPPNMQAGHPVGRAGTQAIERGNARIGRRGVEHSGHPGQGQVEGGLRSASRDRRAAGAGRPQYAERMQSRQRRDGAEARGQRRVRLARNEEEPNEAISDDQSSVAGDSVITPRRPERRRA